MFFQQQKKDSNHNICRAQAGLSTSIYCAGMQKWFDIAIKQEGMPPAVDIVIILSAF